MIESAKDLIAHLPVVLWLSYARRNPDASRSSA